MAKFGLSDDLELSAEVRGILSRSVGNQDSSRAAQSFGRFLKRPAGVRPIRRASRTDNGRLPRCECPVVGVAVGRRLPAAFPAAGDPIRKVL